MWEIYAFFLPYDVLIIHGNAENMSVNHVKPIFNTEEFDWVSADFDDLKQIIQSWVKYAEQPPQLPWIKQGKKHDA